jgi:alcohol dehydrogenase (cytochrome c)/quinohemoprotein ethanol dehydrogenase
MDLMMRALSALAACTATLIVTAALAEERPGVTEDRLLAADAEPGQWLAPGRDHSEQRFSPLNQISDGNVSRLGLAWFADFDTRRAQESTPLVIDGNLYVTTAWSKVYAFDAKTGRPLWKYDPKVPGEWAVNACCDVVNRGLGAWGGKLYLGTMDGRLIALDAVTGQEKWSTQATPKGKPYSITGAPRAAAGKIFVGEAGSEYEQRGFMAAYDAETGKQLWKWWVVPGNPDEGFEQPELAQAAQTWKGQWWKTGGGGAPWDGIAYDPVTHYVLIGTGNGAPWPQSIRSPGTPEHNENLFLSSIVAINADTGNYVWHYQATPSDSWDFDATAQITIADVTIDGRKRHVAMQANKNGLFYVLDVRTGKLLSGTPYVADVNWTLGLDPKSGKPRVNPAALYTEDKGFVNSPPYTGAHNWHPMSYSPLTGLVYIPVLHGSYPYFATHDDDNPMGQKLSISFAKGQDCNPASPTCLSGVVPITPYLLAWNPVTAKEVWRVPFRTGRSGGTLSTAGNLVFQGNWEAFAAYRADTGEKLWSFPAQTGVVAGPVTYSLAGEQYVAVEAGNRVGQENANYYDWNGSRLLVFKLGATAQLPPPPPPIQQVLEPPPPVGTPEQHTRGAEIYNRFCGTCHESHGMFPDLRYSSLLRAEAGFEAVVLGGALTQNGMVSFKQALKPEQVEAIRAYLIHRAIDLKAHLPAPAPAATPAVADPHQGH